MHVPPGASRPGLSKFDRRGDSAADIDFDEGSTAARLRRIRQVVHLMDEAVAIPGTRWRFGLDGLVGLIPGIGDIATTAVSAYVVHQALRMGVPRHVAARMLANVAVDLVLGAVPVLGDLVDFGWKSNSRNLRLLERHVQRRRKASRQSTRGAPGVKWSQPAWEQ